MRQCSKFPHGDLLKADRREVENSFGDSKADENPRR
jgi:hypothetical protein